MSDVAEYGNHRAGLLPNLRSWRTMCDHEGILSPMARVLVERGHSALQEKRGQECSGLSWKMELPKLPDDLEVLHESQVGRITIPSSSGATSTEVTNRLAVYAPIQMDALPLTLEEIFIYELEVRTNEVRDHRVL
jgi:ABC-2 type transport system ATP-binding protein